MAIGSVGLDRLEYNGISFTLYHSRVRAVPVLDSAGRTTKWVDFSIDVDKALVEPAVGETTTDTALLDMRYQLTKIGQELIFENKGYGLLSVNSVNGDIRDAQFGPKPKLLDWQPSGNDQSGFVQWQCQTSIPQCDDARYQFGIAELNYTIEHKIEDGYPTITTTGHLEIPMTRRSDTRLPDHVDRYREQIETKVPLGFQRRPSSFRFNEAKTRLDFSWVDDGLRTAMPSGCTKCDLRHRVSCDNGPAFVRWMNTISGNIQVPPQVPKDFAMNVFLSVVADRISFIRQAVRSRTVRGVALAPGSPEAWAPLFNRLFDALRPRPASEFIKVRTPPDIAVIPKRFDVDNPIGGKDSSFAYTYMVVIRKNIEEDVAAQGVWRPFPGASFEDWRRSMEQLKVFNVRGPHELRWSPADDAIIDLCVSGNATPPASPQGSRTQTIERQDRQHSATAAASAGAASRGAALDPIVQVLGGASADEFDPEIFVSKAASLPNPEASWLAYENVLMYREPRGRYARHRPLSGIVSDPAVSVDASGDAVDLGRIRNFSVATAQKSTRDTLQEIDAPCGVVILKGGALRIGAGTPMPNLLTCNGFMARRNRIIESTPNHIVERMGDLPIVKTTWEIEFLLDRVPPGALPILSDPLLGIDGGTMRT